MHMRSYLSLAAVVCATFPFAVLADHPSTDPADEIHEAPISAVDRDHWSFRPVERPPLPPVSDGSAAWPRTAIDRFILARLEELGLTPLPEADRTTLIRRAYFDIVGLPPTPAEVSVFLTDPAPDAYERLVDRLLASHHYGQRWAQHWLDLARFAETDGFEHDKTRKQAWRYRDWVIDAFNDDLPYDTFVQWQLAGDEIAPDNQAAHMATTFCLAGPDMPDINSQEERRHHVLNEVTSTVGAALMGLQVGCAQCHDHKYDPVSQADFYRLRAVFDPAVVLQKNQSVSVLQSIPRQGPSHLMIRGDWQRRGPEISAGVPRVAVPSGAPAPLRNATHPRTALAKWLTQPDHPLTARVIANRIWQFHVGNGLSRTSSDFGVVGEEPSHPELLDWLATELMRHDWHLKHLHRLIMTSATYRQASRPDQAGWSDRQRADATKSWRASLAVDKPNYWLARFPRRRLTGEEVRDAMLVSSGTMQWESGGPGVRPPLPAELVKTLLKNQWQVSPRQADHYRRSIYIFARRNLRFPIFEAFDRPAGRPTRTTRPSVPASSNEASMAPRTRGRGRRRPQRDAEPQGDEPRRRGRRERPAKPDARPDAPEEGRRKRRGGDDAPAAEGRPRRRRGGDRKGLEAAEPRKAQRSRKERDGESSGKRRKLQFRSRQSKAVNVSEVIELKPYAGPVRESQVIHVQPLARSPKGSTEILFGRIAHDCGFVNKSSLEAAIKEQKGAKKGKGKFLGEILIEKALLTRMEVEEILKIQRRNLSKRYKYRGDEKSQGLFGKLVVKLELASREQVDECVRWQAEMERFDQQVPLGELLIARGYLDDAGVESVLREQLELRKERKRSRADAKAVPPAEEREATSASADEAASPDAGDEAGDDASASGRRRRRRRSKRMDAVGDAAPERDAASEPGAEAKDAQEDEGKRKRRRRTRTRKDDDAARQEEKPEGKPEDDKEARRKRRKRSRASKAEAGLDSSQVARAMTMLDSAEADSVDGDGDKPSASASTDSFYERKRSEPTPAPAKGWFLGLLGRAYGPMPRRLLTTLFEAGAFGADDIFWHHELDGWMMARYIDDFAEAAAAQTPEVPDGAPPLPLQCRSPKALAAKLDALHAKGALPESDHVKLRRLLGRPFSPAK